VKVVAPPNPLRGLSGGDGKYIKAVIDEIGGPVLLVGHSYGGSVITAAGTADNFGYERMGAAVTMIEGASHVVMISHPREVAEVVMTAVRTCAAQSA